MQGACNRFYQDFQQRAIEYAEAQQVQQAFREKRDQWWSEFYQATDEDRAGYLMCETCKCPFAPQELHTRDAVENWEWTCMKAEFDVCHVWCGRDECPNETMEACPGCDHAMCPECWVECTDCQEPTCHDCTRPARHGCGQEDYQGGGDGGIMDIE